MGFYEDFLTLLEHAAYSKFKNPSKLAEYLGAEPNLITRWLNKTRIPKADKMGEVIDALGAELVFALENKDVNEKTASHTQKKNETQRADAICRNDYRPVPLFRESAYRDDPRQQPESWVMLQLNDPAVRLGNNLTAIRLDTEPTGMEPTLRVGDVVLVDCCDSITPLPEKLWLVRFPNGAVKVRHLKIDRIKDRRLTQLTLYGDDVRHTPPEVYSLEHDYQDDMGNLIKGCVVRAWVRTDHNSA